MNYLEFEEPIKTLKEQLDKAKDIEDNNDLDMTTTIVELEAKIEEVTKEIYSKLTPWQRVLVSRHRTFGMRRKGFQDRNKNQLLFYRGRRNHRRGGHCHHRILRRHRALRFHRSLDR